MPLAPYDGNGDLRAYFDHVSSDDGWSTDEGGIHLVAALCGTAAEVLTIMPPGAITLSFLCSALNSRFAREQRSELVKAQLIGCKRKLNETIEELACDIHCAVGIPLVTMAASSQEGLALDHFLQVLSGTDIGALLSLWHPETLNKRHRLMGGLEAAGVRVQVQCHSS